MRRVCWYVSLAAAAGLLGAGSPARAVDVVELTVQEIEAGLAANTFTSVSLTQSFLDRIALYESTYNAFVSLNPDALSIAAALDLEYQLTGPRSPLHGVPVVVKDNMDYAGLVTTNGYAGFSSATGGIDIVPSNDSSVVARLKAAGAVIIGKTNLPDFANDGLRSNSTVAGVTRNPSQLAKATGGSSGGTATAVNASLGVLGLGTETGRSIHNPSSFQSLVGVRPTHALVPIDGIAPLNGSFRDVAGPIAKTVYDAAVTLDAIAGPTPNDPLTAGAIVPAAGYTSQLTTTALQGKKIGYFDPQFLPLGTMAAPTFRTPDAETQTLYDAAMALIGSEGATIVNSDIFGTTWTDKYYAAPSAPNSQRYDQWTYFQDLGPTTPFNSWETYKAELTAQGKVFVDSPFVTETTDTVNTRTSPAGVAWLTWQDELRALFTSTLDALDLDALVWPVNGAAAPLLVGGPNNSPLVQGVINILGAPGVIVPAGTYADGTPFGVIVIGRFWDEANLLGLAYDYEQAAASTALARAVPSLVPEPSSAGLAIVVLSACLLRRRRTVA
ncbi:MAG TPA: amidase [Lacipirellulaceae bacterium]|nr:amidase [Lacipirellulaceae bacterium]